MRFLITASTEGIGMGLSKFFLKRGNRLVISSRSEDKLDSALLFLRRISPAVWGKTSDLTNRQSLIDLVKFSEEIMGGIDVLIVNSGNPRKEPALFEETSYEDWEEAVKLYLFSAVELTRLVLNGMKARKFGRVIYLSSWTVKEPQSIFVLADVSRSPLMQLAKILSRDYGEFNVTFNVILMGSFDTQGARRGISKLAQKTNKSFEEVWKSEVIDRTAIGRIGDPEKDLGPVIQTIVSSPYITGSSFLVDGGTSRSL
ncbi:sugar dehydrogenase [Candidatus Acidianus copahuensis]|uniref:Sugar dehydrogenase n=1 Tax=Candidatus Acidianus copahuensis TaxID=1160895 RepID=A0A031LQS7_9CREN|nr:SDR family NAD(P)-dependent oxidoreductase [Candidatus Acidianus copahuensis]EZQ06774.1 sugar dehydrogenase [Candidatus Acidianus copahuensis]